MLLKCLSQYSNCNAPVSTSQYMYVYCCYGYYRTESLTCMCSICAQPGPAVSSSFVIVSLSKKQDVPVTYKHVYLHTLYICTSSLL